MSGRRRPRAGLDTFSLSFLDAICCGFGAIVLLLVLSKLGEPRALETAQEELQSLVARLERELAEIRGETTVLERELATRVEQLSEEQSQIAQLRGDLSSVEGQYAASRQLSQVTDILEGRLLAAQQELSDEMRRLREQAARPPPPSSLVAGIPVDSEYVIFVIDTSGSMQGYAWPLVRRKMREVLDAYPKVKGMQILNDMGQYMYSQYAGKWIPDTPARRSAILTRLASWNVFSNSSPVEGITRAIRTFSAPDKKISIYVFGDEFTGSSIDDVVAAIDKINRVDARGRRLARIHAIGFPTGFASVGMSESTNVRFATLMRILCERNGGAFIGLPSL